MNDYDSLAYVIADILFSTVALVAMVWPARWAVRVDPMPSLREE